MDQVDARSSIFYEMPSQLGSLVQRWPELIPLRHWRSEETTDTWLRLPSTEFFSADSRLLPRNRVIVDFSVDFRGWPVFLFELWRERCEFLILIGENHFAREPSTVLRAPVWIRERLLSVESRIEGTAPWQMVGSSEELVWSEPITRGAAQPWASVLVDPEAPWGPETALDLLSSAGWPAELTEVIGYSNQASVTSTGKFRDLLRRELASRARGEQLVWLRGPALPNAVDVARLLEEVGRAQFVDAGWGTLFYAPALRAAGGFPVLGTPIDRLVDVLAARMAPYCSALVRFGTGSSLAF